MGQDNGPVAQSIGEWRNIGSGEIGGYAVLGIRAWGAVEVVYDRNTDCQPELTHDLGGG